MNKATIQNVVARRSDNGVIYWDLHNRIISIPLAHQINPGEIEYFRFGWRLGISPLMRTDYPSFSSSSGHVNLIGFSTRPAESTSAWRALSQITSYSGYTYNPFVITVSDSGTQISVASNNYYIYQTSGNYSITGYYGSGTGSAFSYLRRNTIYTGFLIGEYFLQQVSPFRARYTLTFLKSSSFTANSRELFYRMMNSAYDDLAAYEPYSSYYMRAQLTNTSLQDFQYGPLRYAIFMFCGSDDVNLAIYEGAVSAVYALNF